MKALKVIPVPGSVVIAGTDRSQAATMVLDPGTITGGPENRHVGKDPLLYVLSGSGRATVGTEQIGLSPERLLLIEAGEVHEIANTGHKLLDTLNFGAPL